MKKISELFCVFLISISFWSCHSSRNEQEIENLPKMIAAQYAPDKRVAVFDIEIRKQESGTWKLKGETNMDETYRFLLDTLAGLQLQVVDSINLLPDRKLGEHVWGLVTLSAIPMRREPAYSAEMVSQTTLGTPVKLLDKKGGWYRIQTPDLYIGWANSSGVVPFTQAEMAEWKAGNRYVFTAVNGSVVAEPLTEAEPVSDLVLGCIFDVKSQVRDFLQVQFPDKRGGFVKASDCVSFRDWESVRPEAGKVIATARKLLGYPYLWGGTSTKGVDCSGLTKTAYLSQGVMLARDASQQARYGEMLDISDFQFQPGDLLFFGRSKDHITHVGLYIGNGHFIHSSGRVKVNSFNPKDDDFDESRKQQLVAACRVLNSLNTEQIIPIKDHPWYN